MSELTPAAVTLYTLSGYLHCHRARALLRSRGIAFSEVSGDGERDFRRRLLRLTGGATVPQIVIDGEPIGGAHELYELDRRGVLLARVLRQHFPLAVVRRRRRVSRLLDRMRRVPGSSPYSVDIVNSTGRTLARRAAATLTEANSLAQAHRSV